MKSLTKNQTKTLFLAAALALVATSARANPLDDLRARLHGKTKADAGDSQSQGSTGGAIDVAGIKPGMSRSQAAHILMARDPQAKMNKTGDFLWTSSVTKNNAVVKGETIKVDFTVTDHAYRITRTISNGTGGFLYANIMKQLRDKYGPEKVYGGDLYWTLNDDGTVGDACVRTGGGKGSGQDCPPVVIRTNLQPVNPASFDTNVVPMVQVTLTDATIQNAGEAVAKAKRDADTAAKNQQAVQQAAGNSASF